MYKAAYEAGNGFHCGGYEALPNLLHFKQFKIVSQCMEAVLSLRNIQPNRNGVAEEYDAPRQY